MYLGMLQMCIRCLEMVCSTSVEQRLCHYACCVASPQGRLLSALEYANGLQHATAATAMGLVQHLLRSQALRIVMDLSTLRYLNSANLLPSIYSSCAAQLSTACLCRPRH